MARAKASRGGRVGDSPLARQFFAGRYAEIVEAAFDGEAVFNPLDTAFVVGALTFVGRIEDAELCFDGLRLRAVQPDPRTVQAAYFFLGVANARAGNFERAHWFLVVQARARSKSEPWIAAFVFQGLACYRYFTGHYRAAARHALRALRAAHVARFAYVQMLANDLRGHALAQLGQYRAGIGLLEQARLSSERLGFGMNAYAVECSIAIYFAESVARIEALQRIEALLGRRGHDSYSKRSLLAAQATQLALRGRRSEAVRALELADADALATETRRAKLSNVAARLHVLRWSEGAEACAELLDHATDLVNPGDVALRAELLGFEAYVARTLSYGARQENALVALRELARTSEHHQATAALSQLGVVPLPKRAFPEDELSPLLRAVNVQDRTVLSRLLALGLLGLVPELLGFTPDRRIIVLVYEDAVLLEDHGDLQLRPHPPRWMATLLRLLSRGTASKEAIVRALWGLRAYHPDRHDPLIRTTIHRFRALLAPHGDWIFVAESGGYTCRVPIRFVGATVDATEGVELSELAELETPLVEGEAPQPQAAPTAPTSNPETVTTRLFALLLETDRVSVRQASRSLGVSESTALRALRELVSKKRVIRTGYARATRYSARRSH